MVTVVVHLHGASPLLQHGPCRESWGVTRVAIDWLPARNFRMFLFWFIPLLIAVIITLWLMYRSIDRDRLE
jgi:hypothetical protein